MLDKILNLIKGSQGLIDEARRDSFEMITMGKEMFILALDAVQEETTSEVMKTLATMDKNVNELEMGVRKKVYTHLAISRGKDLLEGLQLNVIITDLERIGDEAQKLGILSARLAAEVQPREGYPELKTLGEHVQDMVHDALDAFSRLDVGDALRVVEEDKYVDEEYDMISRQCITLMMEDPGTIRRFMDVSWAARALERIGDHAKNICEYVIYLVEGKDVRHLEIEDLRDQIGSASD